LKILSPTSETICSFSLRSQESCLHNNEDILAWERHYKSIISVPAPKAHRDGSPALDKGCYRIFSRPYHKCFREHPNPWNIFEVTPKEFSSYTRSAKTPLWVTRACGRPPLV